MRFRLFLLLAIVSFLITACSGKRVETTYTIQGVELVMEGPLFEGPNSANITHMVDLSQLPDSLGVTPENIKGATLTTAVFYVADTSNFDLVSDFRLTLTADGAEMTEVAILSPVAAGTNRVALQVSEEADLRDFFRLPEFIILVDAGLKEDLYDNYYLSADLTFTLSVKP